MTLSTNCLDVNGDRARNRRLLVEGGRDARSSGGRAFLGPAVFVSLVLILPSEALAIQTHGGIEGLCAHQFGHVLFFVAMVLLYFRLRRYVERASLGWRCISVACLLFAVWNVVAFFGHWLEAGLRSPIPVVGSDFWDREMVAVNGWKALVLYVCKLDHLFAVAAMVFFLRGLMFFTKEQQ